MVILFQSVKVATALVWLYGLGANAVAAYSVLEIGPNLLAAVTSIVGMIVVVAQLRIARDVKDVKEKAVTAKDKATNNSDRIQALEDNAQ